MSECDLPPCCYPCSQYPCEDPALCQHFMLWADRQLGRCLNCGSWADDLTDDGEYRCPNCSNEWNIYETTEVP